MLLGLDGELNLRPFLPHSSLVVYLLRMRRVSCWFSLLMEDVDGSAECVCNSPVGRLRISATADGVYAVVWLKEGEKGELVGENQDPKDCARARQHLATCTDWLTAYFSGSLLESPVAKPPLVIPKKGAYYRKASQK